MRLLYAFPEPLPLERARGVQVAHSVAELARLNAESEEKRRDDEKRLQRERNEQARYAAELLRGVLQRLEVMLE